MNMSSGRNYSGYGVDSVMNSLFAEKNKLENRIVYHERNSSPLLCSALCMAGRIYIHVPLLCHAVLLQTEAELLAEKRCVAHLTGEVDVVLSHHFFLVLVLLGH